MNKDEREALRRKLMVMHADPAKIDPLSDDYDGQLALTLAMHRLAQANEPEVRHVELPKDGLFDKLEMLLTNHQLRMKDMEDEESACVADTELSSLKSFHGAVKMLLSSVTGKHYGDG